MKKCLVISSIAGLALSVTLPIVLKNKDIQNEIYYKFENKYFSSKE
ncbi:hypothetical protein [Spiroplasma endosymbiont of Atherix ibis]